MPGAEPYAPGMAGDAVIGAGVRGNKALHFLQGRAARPHFLPGEGKIAKTLAKSRHYFSLGGRQRDAVRYLGRHRLWGQGEARNSKDGARRSAAALAEPARRAPPSARGQADLFTAEHPRSARAPTAARGKQRNTGNSTCRAVSAIFWNFFASILRLSAAQKSKLWALQSGRDPCDER